MEGFAVTHIAPGIFEPGRCCTFRKAPRSLFGGGARFKACGNIADEGICHACASDFDEKLFALVPTRLHNRETSGYAPDLLTDYGLLVRHRDLKDFGAGVSDMRGHGFEFGMDDDGEDEEEEPIFASDGEDEEEPIFASDGEEDDGISDDESMPDVCLSHNDIMNDNMSFMGRQIANLNMQMHALLALAK